MVELNYNCVKHKVGKVITISIMLIATSLSLVSSTLTSYASNPNNGNVAGGAPTTTHGPAAPGPGSGGAFLVFMESIENKLTPEEKKMIGSSGVTEYNPTGGNLSDTIAAAAFNINRHYLDSTDLVNIFSATNLRSSGFVARGGFSNANGGQEVNIKALGDINFYLNRVAGRPALDDTDTPPYDPNWHNNASSWEAVYNLMKSNEEVDVKVDDSGTSYKWKWSDRSPEAAHVFSCGWRSIPQFAGCVEYVKGQIKAGLADHQESIFKTMQEFTTLNKSTAEDAPNKFNGYSLILLLAINDIAYDSYATYGGSGDISESIRSTYVHNIEVIEKYYVGGNGPEAKEHQVICFVPVAGQHEIGNTPSLYTLVDALNDAYGSSLTFQQYVEVYLPKVFGENKTRQSAGVENTTGALETHLNLKLRESFPNLATVKEKGIWMYHYFYNNRINPSGGLLYSGNSKKFWTNDFSWNNSVGAFDPNKQLWSPSGYCMMSLGTDTDLVTTDHSPDPPDSDSSGDPSNTSVSGYSPPNYSFTIKADPDSKDLTEASNNGANCVKEQFADITVDISGGSDGTAGAFAWLNNEFPTLANKTFRLTLFLEFEQMKGNSLGNTNHFDQLIVGSSDWTLTTVGGKPAVQSKDCTTLTELNEYITGSKSKFSIYDTNVEVCENLINRYKIYGKLCVYTNGNHAGGDNTDLPAKPSGNVDTSGKAYDDASWVVKPIPHYYSGMLFETPYSEIKHNEPYAEDEKDPTGFGGWEAMAGIPTTADVYVGTGATEYMINVELEWKTQNSQRTYTVTVNNSNCWGNNEPCTDEACPGHPQEDGPTEYCDNSHSCKYANEPKQESYVSHRNDAHPGSCTYTYTLTTPIVDFAYMDITALTLYKLDNIKYNGNKLLTDEYQITFDPEVGYYSFHDQDKYSSGNGRLLFNYTLEQADQLWGNTSVTKGNAINSTHDNCKNTAVNMINGYVSQLTGQTVTVVSDYTLIETSEGYQNAMYYEYTSKPINLSSYKVTIGDFGECDDAESSHSDFKVDKTSSEKFEFNGTPTDTFTVDKLWTNNGDSSSKWGPTEPVTAGYNGDYSSINSKYSQSNNTDGTLLCKELLEKNQPNTDVLEGNDNFEKSTSSVYNGRYVKTGLNIKDSTTPPPDRQWSSGDSKEPVVNGEWNTGNAYAKYSRPISYKTTAMGHNYDQYLKNTEAIYEDGSEKINNIVIHNPVSNRDAVLISNSKEYDQRTSDRVLPPERLDTKNTCPNNATCQYAKLNCTQPMAYHNADCYSVSPSVYTCNMFYNAHYHDPSKEGQWSIKTEYLWQCNYVSCCHKDGSSMWSTSTTDPEPCGGYHHKNGSRIISTRTTRYFQRELEGYNYMGGNGVLYWVASDRPGWDTMSCKFIEGGDYDIVRHNKNFYGYYHIFDNKENICFSCQYAGSSDMRYYNRHTYVTDLNVEYWMCNNKINTHTHNSSCTKATVLNCANPHHQLPGQSVDASNPANHYQKGDARCWSACNDDTKHQLSSTITLPDGTQASMSDTFINIDREFQIYYPDIGDFEQSPTMWGIANTTDIRGPGYTNNMQTDTWLRNKYVTFPMAVKDPYGNIWGAGEPIDLLKQPNIDNKYTFHCLLANEEAAGTKLSFVSVGNNAKEMKVPNGADHHTNDIRKLDKAARDSTIKYQFFDIVGSIGSLKINDTGDLRFATLFNQVKAGSNKWLIPNVVPEVDYTKPNKIVSDNITSLNDKTSVTGKYHHVYGVTDMPTGGVAFPYAQLPLTPKDNPIPALRKEAMRPGYNLFMDVETVGSYQGQNVYYENDNPTPIDVPRTGNDGSGAFTYKMQIIPKYYELTLSGPDKGKYKEVDIYMYSNYTYQPVYLGFDRRAECTEYYNYLNWLAEAPRRSFTPLEQSQAIAYQKMFTKNYTELEGGQVYYVPRFPVAEKDTIGTPNILVLTDLDRTYIGSSQRYGNKMWGGNEQLGITDSRITELAYLKQSQRWHFTLGLPSSSVFVYKGQQCTDLNIKELKSHDAVIVCQLNIKVKGNVWTLEYDGTALNNNIQIYPDGEKMPPPPNPKDPIVVVYDNEKTSKDDMATQGTQ